MAIAINAAGQHIPPFYLFPRKKIGSDFMCNATPSSVGYANGSGYMTQADFVNFIRHFITYSGATKDNQSLLILDNHTSHPSIEAIDLAVDNGVVMLSLPPHCSHRMQPLDVAVFAPLKTFYKGQCDAWSMNQAGKLIEIQHVPEIVDRCLDLAFTAKNIKSGFNATGIFPMNPNIFGVEDFQLAAISDENVSAIADSHANEDDQRQIIFFDNPPAAEEEVTSSISNAPSTSGVSLDEPLSKIGPVQPGTPRKKSNRGRKAMQSAVLTSAEKRKELGALAEKRKANAAMKQKLSSTPAEKSTPAKKRQRKRSPSSSSESDEDFCIICLSLMPKKCTKLNTLSCLECKREVHLKCAGSTQGFWICANCEPDSD